MGIDGIGKPPAPGAIGGLGGATPVKTGETFEVTAPGSSEAASGSDALSRLRSGEISIDDYLEDRIEQAVGHLQLPAEQLQFVKDTLREQLASDPVLVELVRRTTA
ncbi:MAG TPA: hypothetical protein VK524_01655 [Polyangiaceae bacterium]|nr:hypothetical protein [Polyangiaceae bacterium]